MKRKSLLASGGHQQSAAGIDTSNLTGVNESLVSGPFVRLAKEMAERDQGPRAPKMNDFKTSVFNRNSKPDTLVSYIVPTEEQKAKRAALKEAQEQAEKERVEKLRQERNRKTKIALSQKQKMHAMKLFHVLGGVVSRKELEKVAFKAHGLETALNSAKRKEDTDGWAAAPKQLQRAQSAANGHLRV